MFKLAANPSALPNLSMCILKRANGSRSTCNGCVRLCSSYGVLRGSTVAAIAADFFHQDADENFALACVCRSVSRLLLGHRFGAFHAPCGSSLFCFGKPPQQVNPIPAGDPGFYAALRVTVSLQILFGKYTEKISPDPP